MSVCSCLFVCLFVSVRLSVLPVSEKRGEEYRERKGGGFKRKKKFGFGFGD